MLVSSGVDGRGSWLFAVVLLHVVGVVEVQGGVLLCAGPVCVKGVSVLRHGDGCCRGLCFGRLCI